MTMRFKTLARNITVLNVLLLAGVALCALYVIPPLLGTKVALTVPSAKKSVEEKEEKPAEATSLSPLKYSVIAEQNLFHAERKIPEKVETAALPKPEFVLYGTMITNGLSIAYMEDLKAPASTPGRGKRQRALRAGSLLSGYTLSEVYQDKVVMAMGTDKIEVKVLDNKHKAAKAGEGGPPKTAEALQPQLLGSAQTRSLTTTREASSLTPLPSGTPPQSLTKQGGIQAPPAVGIRKVP